MIGERIEINSERMRGKYFGIKSSSSLRSAADGAFRGDMKGTTYSKEGDLLRIIGN